MPTHTGGVTGKKSTNEVGKIRCSYKRFCKLDFLIAKLIAMKLFNRAINRD